MASNTPGGSLNTPGTIGNGGDPHNRSSGGITTDDVNKAERFRFDLASTGKYINEQQQQLQQQQLHRHHLQQQQQRAINLEYDMNANDAVCCDDVRMRTSATSRGSHGKLHHQMSHTSCTSLGQTNISTSDQQPLIVDGQTNYRCTTGTGDYHYQGRPQQQHCTAGRQCCLRTTSFMADTAAATHCTTANCTCCESAPLPPPPPALPRLRSSLRGEYPNHQRHSNRSSRGVAAEDEDDVDIDADDYVDDDDQVSNTDDGSDFHHHVHHSTANHKHDEDYRNRSKTLTRIYKPLNDVNFSKNQRSNSNNNLIDTNNNNNNNFCLPVNNSTTIGKHSRSSFAADRL